MSDLATRFRPRALNQIIGQDSLGVLYTWYTEKAIPHVILFYGPSGTGKTTAARVLANMVEAKPSDITEIDVADERGIDMARDLIEQTGPWSKPLPPSKVKVVIIDEVVQLPETTQQAMLTMLEEPEPWVYFFLCTTRINKLLDTFKSRCKILKLQPVDKYLMRSHLQSITRQLQLEESDVSGEVIMRIADRADGNMRFALQMLEQVIAIRGREHQLIALDVSVTDDTPKDIGDLCRLLLKPASLKEIYTCLDAITDAPETVRIRVLAYANKALRGGNDRASALIRAFQYDFSQYATIPQAGLALACRDAFAALRGR